jgi:hypothetical protein
MKSLRLFGLLLSLALTQSAWAFDSYLEVDRDVSLSDLAARGTPLVSSGRDGGMYWADASAVLSRVSVEKLFAAAQDYGHYTDFGMPYLNQSRIVEKQTPEHLFTWASMTYRIAGISISSQYYLEVNVRSRLDNRGGRGMEWQIVPKKREWSYADNHSRFSKNDGSFYILPLANGRVYVRYYVTSDIQVPLGRVGRFFGGNKVIQGALRQGASSVITALAKQAAVR